MSPRKRATRAAPTPVETIKHKDERANIPTNELRGMLADDERSPKKLLYSRDPSLDPQLVWKGKDEQNAADLEVPVVPIYIQEKVQPVGLAVGDRWIDPMPSRRGVGERKRFRLALPRLEWRDVDLDREAGQVIARQLRELHAHLHADH